MLFHYPFLGGTEGARTIGACSILIVCAGAVFAAFSIIISISFFDIFAPPLDADLPLFLPASTPKVASTPVKTEAMKVGSILSCFAKPGKVT